jgi:hypothetical protein
MRKSICCFVIILVGCLLFGKRAHAQNLFEIDTIRTVEINFYDSNWDYLLDSLAMLGTGTGSGTERILANVVIDGTSMDSCGVRYKGNSSMDTSSNKNPFNIDLNFVVIGQKYMGKNKIKLANCYTDPSMVREALMYEISNQYMDCSQASFVKVYTNGTYRGIYTNTESVDNEFLDAFYGSSTNPFFKCDPISFDFAGGNSNLGYYADTMAYDTLYDMKSTYGYTELQELCYNLEYNAANIDQYLDVDRALWFLALSSAFVHNDGYTAFGHNYYVYKMDNGRWSIVIWDLNMSFGGLLWNGTNWLPLSLNQLQTQDPFLHEGSFGIRPLIAQLLSIPKYKRIYSAHFKTIIEQNVANDNYLVRGEYMQNLIDPDVQNEPFSGYSYAQFAANMYTDVGSWYGFRPGLQNLMTGRESYLNTVPEFQLSEPVISNVLTSSNEPLPYSLVTITANVSNASTVMLGYRHNHYQVFDKIDMFDDGLHNDGASGDGTYGVELPINATSMEYYIYADNGNAAKFSPVRAEYEFYVLTPQLGLVINEIAADNNSIAFDQDWEYDDWIELYNNSEVSIDLTGYYLSDNPGNLTKWTFPNVSIGPGEYLIVWADTDTLQLGLHTNFSLSNLGETLFLSDDMGSLLDQIAYPYQAQDFTFGRYGNGLGSFLFLYPTFNAENTTPLDLVEHVNEGMFVYPNPATNTAILQFSSEVSTNVTLRDVAGKLVLADRIIQSDTFEFDVSSLDAGIYFITTSEGISIKLLVQ